MKINFILLILLALPLLCKSQETNPKYYNNINKVGRIETTNSEINIKKADTVVIKIFMTNNAKLLLDGYQQIKDSTGNYISYFHFITDNEISCDINLLFRFNKPMLGGRLSMPKGASGAGQLSTSFSEDKTGCQFRGSMTCEKGLIAVFKSSERTTVSIRGIEGIKKN